MRRRFGRSWSRARICTMLVNSNTSILVYATLATYWFFQIRTATKVTSLVHAAVLIGKSTTSRIHLLRIQASITSSTLAIVWISIHAVSLTANFHLMTRKRLSDNIIKPATYVSKLNVLITNRLAFKSMNLVRIDW